MLLNWIFFLAASDELASFFFFLLSSALTYTLKVLLTEPMSMCVYVFFTSKLQECQRAASTEDRESCKCFLLHSMNS